jgi:hypothetical protein
MYFACPLGKTVSGTLCRCSLPLRRYCYRQCPQRQSAGPKRLLAGTQSKLPALALLFRDHLTLLFTESPIVQKHTSRSVLRRKPTPEGRWRLNHLFKNCDDIIRPKQCLWNYHQDVEEAVRCKINSYTSRNRVENSGEAIPFE